MEGLQYGTQQGFNPQQTYNPQQGFNPLQGFNPQAFHQQGFNPQGLNQGYAGGSQFSPWQTGQQGLFGGANMPLGGLIGSGIAGLMGGQNYGRQPGQVIDGISAVFQGYNNPYNNQLFNNQPYNNQLYSNNPLYSNVDPITAVHLQQHAQLAQLAQQLGQQQQIGRLGLDPISLAIAQQRAQFGQQLGQPGQMTPWLNPMNRIDPVTAAYIQQAQIAQLCQQLALQSQLGQQNQFGQQGQFGNQAGQGNFGLGHVGQQGLFGQGHVGFGSQNLWPNPQLAAQFGRMPSPYGMTGATGGYGGGQLPVY